MNCEICGNPIRGPPAHVVVEGARLVVCPECSTHGEDYWHPVAPSKTPEQPTPKSIKAKPRMQMDSLPKGYAELEPREDYANRIRKAREKRGLSQEDLANLAKERLSIIQKIELGKMIPNLQLSRILEHVLKMKLLVPAAEPDSSKQTVSETLELTIGDVIQFKKKEGKQIRGS